MQDCLPASMASNARLSACLDGIQCIKARLRNTSNHITAPQKLQYTISIIQASENVNEFHAFVNRGVEFYIEKSLSRGEFIDVEFPVLLDAHWDKPYNISIQLRDKALHFHNYYLDTLSLLAPSRKEYAKHAVVNYDDVIALESELLIKRKEVERLVKMAIPLFKILKEAKVDTRRFSLDTQSDQKLDFIFHVLINAIDRNEIEIEGFELSVAELDSLYYNILLDKV
jgi:hypothetical protein